MLSSVPCPYLPPTPTYLPQSDYLYLKGNNIKYLYPLCITYAGLPMTRAQQKFYGYYLIREKNKMQTITYLNNLQSIIQYNFVRYLKKPRVEHRYEKDIPNCQQGYICIIILQALVIFSFLFLWFLDYLQFIEYLLNLKKIVFFKKKEKIKLP